MQQGVEASQKQLRAEKSRLEKLQTAQLEVMERVKRLAETLNQEARLRDGAEQQAGAAGQRGVQLEVQLEQARQELDAVEKQLHASQQSSGAERAGWRRGSRNCRPPEPKRKKNSSKSPNRWPRRASAGRSPRNRPKGLASSAQNLRPSWDVCART